MTRKLKDLKLRGVYSTEDDSILKSFYLPALSVASQYDRAVGYFSSSSLALACQGISSFLENNARLRLVVGDYLGDDEYDAVKSGYDAQVLHNMKNKLYGIIQENSNSLLSVRLELLSWLVSQERLEIRFAFRKQGIFHQKIGIIHDHSGDRVVFQGSANETSFALLPEFNSETVSVYPSWNENVYAEYGRPYESAFEAFWDGTASNIHTLPVPSDFYEILSSIRSGPNSPVTPRYTEEEIIKVLEYRKSGRPEIPKYISGIPYALREHQLDALESWKGNELKGIMALATGSGKTITAIHGVTRIYQAANRKLACIITVPYVILAEQWAENLNSFNIDPILCFGGESSWFEVLSDNVSSFIISEDPRFLCVVVVNATLRNDSFQKLVGQLPGEDMVVIGDECHRLDGPIHMKLLPDANMRLGLSATPWAYSEESKKSLLKSYFGPIVAEYSIDKAIGKVLCEYDYFPILVHLSDDEAMEYERISSELARCISANEASSSKTYKGKIDTLLGERARLLGSVEDKIVSLDAMTPKLKLGSHMLVYCGDGSTEGTSGVSLRDIEKVGSALSSTGISTSRITASETAVQRRRILEQFRDGTVQAIAAIRVLDEGFDLPACKVAVLMASSRNERQFIQRRGRILRKSPGKASATIWDMIVVPGKENTAQCFRKLLKDELRRAYEFCRVSRNRDESMNELKRLASGYGLDFQAIAAEEERKNERKWTD